MQTVPLFFDTSILMNLIPYCTNNNLTSTEVKLVFQYQGIKHTFSIKESEQYYLRQKFLLLEELYQDPLLPAYHEMKHIGGHPDNLTT